MDINKILYRRAQSAALRVDFLDTKEELNLYVKALYRAMKWGKTVK